MEATAPLAIVAPRPAALVEAAGSWGDAVGELLRGKARNTLDAYRRDLIAFAHWLGVATIDDAAEALLGSGRAAAHATARRFRDEALDAGLAPSTVNRRLAALRTLAKVARELGLTDYALELASVPRHSDIDRRTAGCGRETIAALLATADAQADRYKAARDGALVGLMFALGLRVSEVVALDLVDYDAAAATLSITGKGRRSRTVLTVPARIVERLAAWLAVRGSDAGALFGGLRGPGGRGARITRRGVSHLLADLSTRAGVPAVVACHDVRRSAITATLDATGGDIRTAQRFARHSDPRTTMRYDVARTDLAGRAATLIAL